MATQLTIETELPGNTDRLFAAADYLLWALNSPTGHDTVVSMVAAGRNVGGAERFTCEELIEAMSMLVRMGLDKGPPMQHRRFVRRVAG